MTVSAFHIFHRWTKWSEAQTFVCERAPVLGSESAITFSMGWNASGQVQYEIEQQRRVCVICGAEQTRRV